MTESALEFVEQEDFGAYTRQCDMLRKYRERTTLLTGEAGSIRFAGGHENWIIDKRVPIPAAEYKIGALAVYSRQQMHHKIPLTLVWLEVPEPRDILAYGAVVNKTLRRPTPAEIRRYSQQRQAPGNRT